MGVSIFFKFYFQPDSAKEKSSSKTRVQCYAREGIKTETKRVEFINQGR